MSEESSYELEDDFEEFDQREQALSPERQEDVRDRVTIWLNSWMDEDDGDFENQLSDTERIKP